MLWYQRPFKSSLDRAASYLFKILIIRALAVRSIDLTPTRIVGVIGARTCFAGKKLITALMILFPTDCRFRTRPARQFKVALTRRGSLQISPPVSPVSILLAEGEKRSLTSPLPGTRTRAGPEGPRPQPRGSGARVWGGFGAQWPGRFHFGRGAGIKKKSIRRLSHFLRRIKLEEHTRGSAIEPWVCTCTTRCTNLMQHSLTANGKSSHLRRISCLMAVICSQASESFGRLMLKKDYQES